MKRIVCIALVLVGCGRPEHKKDALVAPKTMTLHWTHDGKNVSNFVVWSSTDLSNWSAVATLSSNDRSYVFQVKETPQFFKVAAK